MNDVLIVDDEEHIVELVKHYLAQEGLATREAYDGAAALAAFRAAAPSLVILDLMLPGLAGTEVCREIRKTSDVPILMLTAKDDIVDKVVGFELGADDYLTKPFQPKELVARVKALRRRANRLLLALARRPGQVLTREQLLNKVWGYDFEGFSRTVDVHVQHVREKVEAAGGNPGVIATVWGVGYKFEDLA
jgi:DNA-binding response OmpR family regulator